jgi:hypothetical protein
MIRGAGEHGSLVGGARNLLRHGLQSRGQEVEE